MKKFLYVRRRSEKIISNNYYIKEVILRLNFEKKLSYDNFLSKNRLHSQCFYTFPLNKFLAGPLQFVRRW